MLRSVLLIFLGVHLVTSVYHDSPTFPTKCNQQVKQGDTYRYRYEAHVVTGLPGATAVVAGYKLFTDVDIKFESPTSVLVKMVSPLISVLSDEVSRVDPSREMLPNAFFQPIFNDESENLREQLTKPFIVKYADGHLIGIKLQDPEPVNITNIRRGLANLLQLNIRAPPTKVSRTSQTPYTYSVFEAGVTGICDTQYTYLPRPSSDLVRRWESNNGVVEVVEIVKSRNFSLCSHRPNFHKTVLKGRKCSQCNVDPMKSEASVRYNIEKQGQHFVIVNAIGTSQQYVTPFSESAGKIAVMTNQTLVHVDCVSWTKPKPQVSEPVLSIVAEIPEVVDQEWNPDIMEAPRVSVQSQPGIQITKKMKDLVKIFVRNAEKIVTDDASKAQILMVNLGRTASKEQLQQVWEDILTSEKWEKPEQKNLAHHFLWKVLPVIGNTAVVQMLTDELMKQQPRGIDLPEDIAVTRRVVQMLSLTAEPNEVNIENIIKLTNSPLVKKDLTLKRVVFLAIGTVAQRLRIACDALCTRIQKTLTELKARQGEDSENTVITDSIKALKNRSTMAMEKYSTIKTKIVSVLKQLVQQEASSQTEKEQQRILFLKAVGNSGFTEFIDEILPILSDRSIPKRVRNMAIWSIRHFGCQKPDCQKTWQICNQVQSQLLSIFMNRFENTTVRISAFQVLVSTMPQTNVFHIIGSQVARETNREVQSYVISHLISLANSSMPCSWDLAKNASLALQFVQQSTQLKGISRSFQQSFFSQNLQIGGSVTFSLLAGAFSPEIQALGTVNLHLFGREVEYLSVGIKSENLLRQIVLGTQGIKVHPQESTDTIEVFVSVDGNELQYNEVQVSVSSNGIRINQSDLPKDIDIHQAANSLAALATCSVTHTAPTETGLNLQMALQSSLVSKSVGNLKASYKSEQTPVTAQIQSTMDSSIAGTLISYMMIDGVFIKPGVGVTGAISARLPSNVLVSVKQYPNKIETTAKIVLTGTEKYTIAQGQVSPYTMIYYMPSINYISEKETPPGPIIKTIPVIDGAVVIPFVIPLSSSVFHLPLQAEGMVVSRSNRPALYFHPLAGKNQLTITAIPSATQPPKELRLCMVMKTQKPLKESLPKYIRNPLKTQVEVSAELQSILSDSTVVRLNATTTVGPPLSKKTNKIDASIILKSPNSDHEWKVTVDGDVSLNRDPIEPICLFDCGYQKTLVRQLGIQAGRTDPSLRDNFTFYNFIASEEKMWHQWMSLARFGESYQFSFDDILADFYPIFTAQVFTKTELLQLPTIIQTQMVLGKNIQEVMKQCTDPFCAKSLSDTFLEWKIKFTELNEKLQKTLTKLNTVPVPKCKLEPFMKLHLACRVVLLRQLILIQQAMQIIQMTGQYEATVQQMVHNDLKNITNILVNKIIPQQWVNVKQQQQIDNQQCSDLSSWKPILLIITEVEKKQEEISEYIRKNKTNTYVESFKEYDRKLNVLLETFRKVLNSTSTLPSEPVVIRIEQLILQSVSVYQQLFLRITCTPLNDSEPLFKLMVVANLKVWQLLTKCYLLAHNEQCLLAGGDEKSKQQYSKLQLLTYRQFDLMASVKRSAREMITTRNIARHTEQLETVTKEIKMIQNDVQNILKTHLSQSQTPEYFYYFHMKAVQVLVHHTQAINQLLESLKIMYYTQALPSRAKFTTYQRLKQKALELQESTQLMIIQLKNSQPPIVTHSSISSHGVSPLCTVDDVGKPPLTGLLKVKYTRKQQESSVQVKISASKSIQQILWAIRQNQPANKDPLVRQLLQNNQSAFYAQETSEAYWKIRRELNSLRHLKIDITSQGVSKEAMDIASIFQSYLKYYLFRQLVINKQQITKEGRVLLEGIKHQHYPQSSVILKTPTEKDFFSSVQDIPGLETFLLTQDNFNSSLASTPTCNCIVEGRNVKTFRGNSHVLPSPKLHPCHILLVKSRLQQETLYMHAKISPELRQLQTFKLVIIKKSSNSAKQELNFKKTDSGYLEVLHNNVKVNIPDSTSKIIKDSSANSIFTVSRNINDYLVVPTSKCYRVIVSNRIRIERTPCRYSPVDYACGVCQQCSPYGLSQAKPELLAEDINRLNLHNDKCSKIQGSN